MYARLTLALALGPLLQAQTNTLLIVGDDMGIDTIGAYKAGAAPPPTPNLDRLAAEGLLFRRAYATPMCTPTRATLMTGRYGFRNGVGRAGVALPLTETTLPEILAPAKVATALVGKWHMGGNRAGNLHPNQSGWSHFAGHVAGNIGSTETYFSWRRVVDGRAGTSSTYATTQNVDDALAWIKAQTGTWVLSLNFQAPHTPFHAPPSHLHSRNLSGKRLPRDRLDFYKAMIEAMDTEIGRLLSSIDASTMSRTHVIFLGDNGSAGPVIEAPFSATKAKSTLYEGGWQVPLIIRGPLVQHPGREVGALVHSTDLFCTIAELAGVDANQAVPAGTTLDGRSLVPYLKDRNQAPLREFVYSELFSTTQNDRALRDDRFKLIARGAGGEEFFDLSSDPFETRNLLGGSLNGLEQERLGRLRAELARLAGRASWYPLGQGCAGKGQAPMLATTSGARPVLGQMFTLQVSQLHTTATRCLGILGFERLSLDLSAHQAPGCTLYTGLDTLLPLPVSGGSADFTVLIPPVSELLGLRFRQQAIVFEPGANHWGALLSNAGEGVIERQ